MARTKILGAYNIHREIIAEAERQGLDAMATGGGMDYIYKELGKNEDGSPRVALLCDALESGGPDFLRSKSDVQIMLSEDWTSAVAIPAGTAKDAMAMMKSMFDPYQM